MLGGSDDRHGTEARTRATERCRILTLFCAPLCPCSHRLPPFPPSFLLTPCSWQDEVIEQLEEGVITRLLSKFPPASPSHTSITTSFVEEICSLRLRAVKKATLDYILMSPKERKRLGIEQIPPDVKVDGFGWGEGKLFLRSPGPWRDNFNGVLEKFGTYSIIATPITIANALWQDFEQLRLVDVVSGYRESLERGHPSVSIVVFEREQMSHLNSVVAGERREQETRARDGAKTAKTKQKQQQGTHPKLLFRCDALFTPIWLTPRSEFKDNWLVNLKHIFAETISDGEYLVEEALMKRYVREHTALKSETRERPELISLTSLNVY